MSMRSMVVFAILALAIVGINATAYRVQETEKAILLEFGNIVGADIKPGLHFKMPGRLGCLAVSHPSPMPS